LIFEIVFENRKKLRDKFDKSLYASHFHVPPPYGTPMGQGWESRTISIWHFDHTA